MLLRAAPPRPRRSVSKRFARLFPGRLAGRQPSVRRAPVPACGLRARRPPVSVSAVRRLHGAHVAHVARHHLVSCQCDTDRSCDRHPHCHHYPLSHRCHCKAVHAARHFATKKNFPCVPCCSCFPQPPEVLVVSCFCQCIQTPAGLHKTCIHNHVCTPTHPRARTHTHMHTHTRHAHTCIPTLTPRTRTCAHTRTFPPSRPT